MDRRVRRTMQIASLFCAIIGASSLQVRADTTLSNSGVSNAPAPGRGQDTADRRIRLALRLGGAGPASGGVLTGIDVTVPTLRIGQRWSGRIDYDGWQEIDLSFFNFAGHTPSNRSFSITIDQLTTSALDASGAYAGFGIGYSRVEDGSSRTHGPVLKLIGGANLSGFLGAEVAMHLTERDLTFMGAARIRF
jgi:hypothetical protein